MEHTCVSTSMYSGGTNSNMIESRNTFSVSDGPSQGTDENEVTIMRTPEQIKMRMDCRKLAKEAYTKVTHKKPTGFSLSNPSVAKTIGSKLLVGLKIADDIYELDIADASRSINLLNIQSWLKVASDRLALEEKNGDVSVICCIKK